MEQKTELKHLGELENSFPREIKMVRQFYFLILNKEKITLNSKSLDEGNGSVGL